jgi:hypothetical protein
MAYDEGQAKKLVHFIGTTLMDLVMDYTSTALLLNSAELAAKNYRTVSPDFRLSTTARIPPTFRGNMDVDVTFTGEQLVNKYTTTIVEKIASDYLVRTVSLVDGFLEDLYECFLGSLHPDLDDKKIANLVRSAWANDSLRTFFLQELGIVAPPGKKSTPDLVFDRYEEWREVRHSIVHNGGNLSDKHIRKLTELQERVPSPDHQGLLSSPLIKDGRVVASYGLVLVLREWAYACVAYFRDSFLKIGCLTEDDFRSLLKQ